jgi:hypothetical protein
VSLEDLIIEVYCVVDDSLRQVLAEVGKLRSRGFDSQLDDAEVITMEIIGEYQGIDTDAGILRYFGEHWRNLFPKLPTRCNFSRQAANLGRVKAMIQRRLAAGLVQPGEAFLTDGVPMPICHLKRSGRSGLFRGEAEYGYCATKEEHYYGFKGLIVTTLSGVIIDYTVGGAKLDERQALIDCADTVRGRHGIGDKGFIGAAYQADLQSDFGITLHTLVRSNMEETRPRDFLRWLVGTRRLVETVIGQLTERLHFNKVWARNLFRLAGRVARKVLAHTVAVMLLWRTGRYDLQIEQLVAS